MMMGRDSDLYVLTLNERTCILYLTELKKPKGGNDKWVRKWEDRMLKIR